MRLIDADALLAILEDEEKYLETFEFQLAAMACINHIKEAPTIDREEVRCIECEYCGARMKGETEDED